MSIYNIYLYIVYCIFVYISVHTAWWFQQVPTLAINARILWPVAAIKLLLSRQYIHCQVIKESIPTATSLFPSSAHFIGAIGNWTRLNPKKARLGSRQGTMGRANQQRFGGESSTEPIHTGRVSRGGLKSPSRYRSLHEISNKDRLVAASCITQCWLVLKNRLVQSNPIQLVHQGKQHGRSPWLQVMKAKTMYEMVEELDTGQSTVKMLFLTNPQAKQWSIRMKNTDLEHSDIVV